MEVNALAPTPPTARAHRPLMLAAIVVIVLFGNYTLDTNNFSAKSTYLTKPLGVCFE
jgi:hypothetical protein